MDELREQLKTSLDDLPQLFGKLQELLAGSPLTNDLALIKARYDETDKSRDLNLISVEEADLIISQVRNAVVKFIDRIGPDDIQQKKASSNSLGDYHIYTCDRVDQNDQFQKVFSENKARKTHFFYLYGLDLQSHRGIFKRIAFDLEGRLSDYVSPDLEVGVKCHVVDLTFDLSRDIEVYKQNILKHFMAGLSVRVNEHEPIIQKDINWLRENSPLLQGMGGQDYVCVFIGISEYEWDKEITPEATRWFINQFCASELPDDSPTYLFFFAIIYEEDNSPVEEEVVAALEASENVKNGKLIVLPELEMVGRRDIGAWFNKYSFIASGARELKELRTQYFGSVPEHYMDEVENKLKQLVDKYNGNQ